jgi:hypothetical protein
MASETAEAKEEFDCGCPRSRGRRRIDGWIGGGPLLTWWPGYALETRTRLLPGLEDQFGLKVANYVSDREKLKRLHVYSIEDIDRRIRERKADVVVVGIWAGIESRVGREYYERLLIENGYTLTDRIGTAYLYTVPPSAGGR